MDLHLFDCVASSVICQSKNINVYYYTKVQISISTVFFDAHYVNVNNLILMDTHFVFVHDDELVAF